MKPDKVKHIAAAGLFAALAVALSVLEGLLPPLPVPGAKLGLANLAVMAALLVVSFPCAAGVTAVKAGFALLRGPLAFCMSAAGGVLALLAMAGVRRAFAGKISGVSLGLVGAVAHNVGQWLAAVCVFGSAMVYYAPVLLLFALPAGALTGVVMSMLKPYLLNFGKRKG